MSDELVARFLFWIVGTILASIGAFIAYGIAGTLMACGIALWLVASTQG